MANTIRNLYSNTAGNTPSSLGNGVIAVNQADGKLFFRNGSGVVTALATGGGSSLVSYATAASFPATGSSTTLYLASDSSKLYRWESTVYVEIGTVAPVVSASDITIGTLADARLSDSARSSAALYLWANFR